MYKSEARKRYQTRDHQLHKFIRTNGTLTKHPKEDQLYSKIEEDMKLVQKLQKEKILLANTALFLISKHLYHFETDIAKLERDELLPPLEHPIELTEVPKTNTQNHSMAFLIVPLPHQRLGMDHRQLQWQKQ